MKTQTIARCAPWEEFCGVVHDIQENEGFVALGIGQRRLALPIDVGNMLRPYVGRRISLLRTDLEDESFIAILLNGDGKVMGSPISLKKGYEWIGPNLSWSKWRDDALNNINNIKCMNSLSYLDPKASNEQFPAGCVKAT
ncbi:MAG: hypothetical protein WBN94_01320 [Methanothrix sp.]